MYCKSSFKAFSKYTIRVALCVPPKYIRILAVRCVVTVRLTVSLPVL